LDGTLIAADGRYARKARALGGIIELRECELRGGPAPTGAPSGPAAAE
jgi:hypothetical protein